MHYEGYNPNENEEDLNKFMERVEEIWKKEGAKAKGKAEERYELTIAVRNRRGVFEPTVTTGKGVYTLYIWNLTTEDIKKIKKKANEIGLSVIVCPYYWPETPTVFPGELPPESLPQKRAEE